MPTIKPSWYAAFERQQLNTQQMERQKFEEELASFVEPKDQLTRGTRPPSAEQLLRLVAQYNKDKRHLWL